MRALAALLAVLALAAAPAAAAPPSDLSADPLDRGTLLALPSVYRVTVTIDVAALVTEDGRRIPLEGEARRITETGTAFGVAPGGWLATARHVAAPDDADIAELAYRTREAFAGRAHGDPADAEAWVRRTGARPVGARVSRVVAQADAGDGRRAARTYRVVRTVPGAGGADVALIRIDAPGAPALELDEAASRGTPVVTIGFGRGSALAGDDEELGELEPAIRRGELSRTGSLQNADPPRQAIAISVPVRAGDSGAPVVDADGRVRGMVIQRAREGGIAERATELRQLMDATGVTPATGVAAGTFRDGMAALWRLDPEPAREAFEDTLAAFPNHTLAGREAARAEALAAGDVRLAGERRGRGLLLGVGIVAAVVALGFAAALVTPRSPGGSAPRGR